MMTGGKTDDLRGHIQRCFDENTNLLPDIYGWNRNDNRTY
jgi:hypothetical protein